MIRLLSYFSNEEIRFDIIIQMQQIIISNCLKTSIILCRKTNLHLEDYVVLYILEKRSILFATNHGTLSFLFSLSLRSVRRRINTH